MSGQFSSRGAHQPGPVQSSDNLFLGPTWPETKLGGWALRGFGSLVAGAIRGAEAIRGAGVELGASPQASERDAVSRWLDQRVWPARPLRIALSCDDDFTVGLAAARGVFLPEWLHDWERHHSREGVVDAHVHVRDNGAVDITTYENSALDAAWFDWSQERPLSFPGVFPARVDCAQVTLDPDALGQVDPRLARLLCEGAALLSRHPARVTLEDRLNGRNAGWAVAQPEPDFTMDPFTILVRELADALHMSEPTVRRSPAARCAARVLSAWAASSDEVEESVVRSAAEVAWDVNQDEAETALRVGAVRLAQSDDQAGFEALERAAETLRGREVNLNADQLEFIASELRTLSHTSGGVGRAAAGIVLLGATMPSEHLRHFKDDLLEDVRLSGVLAEQDQHMYVILQTFRMLERRAGVHYVPSRDDEANATSIPSAPTSAPFAMSFSAPTPVRARRKAKTVRSAKGGSAKSKPKSARPGTKPGKKTGKRAAARSTKSLQLKKQPAQGAGTKSRRRAA